MDIAGAPDARPWLEELDRVRTLQQSGQEAQAIAACARLAEQHPAALEVLVALGSLLLQAQRWDEALQLCAHSLAQWPAAVDVRMHQAIALWQLQRRDEARAAFLDTLALHPDHARTLANFATLLSDAGLHHEALPWCERSVQAMPEVPHLHNNLGLAQLAHARYRESLESFERAHALQPVPPTAQYNRSFVRLLLGDLAGGFDDYEARFEGSGLWPQGRPDFGLPPWDGSPLAGRSLLVVAEQGLGDTLQFIRHLLELPGRGAGALHVHVQPELIPVLAGIAAIADVQAVGSAIPRVDLVAPLLSLPRLLGIRLETIPAPLPYLEVPAARAATWNARVPAAEFLVGLCWAGNATHPRDRERSIPWELLGVLASSGARFVSLQRGAALEEALAHPGLPMDWLSTGFADFGDTAAVIRQLDLVVTVDTSVAHLAGGLGCPTWLLLTQVPDPRWMLDRHDSPWYPGMRLFRQDATRDWVPVLAQVAQALAEARQEALASGGALASSLAHSDALIGAARWEDARHFATRALRAHPDCAGLYGDLAVACWQLGLTDRALAAFGAAIALAPDDGAILANLAALQFELEDVDSALRHQHQAVALLPQDADLWTNLAAMQERAGRFRDAITSLDRALDLRPGLHGARFDRGVMRLLTGDWPAGWDDYEARLESAEGRQWLVRLEARAPRWQGEALDGRVLAIACEQGFGDSLHFARFVFDLPALRPAGIVLVVQPELRELLAHALTGVAEVVARGEPLPAFDCCVSLPSLPSLFRSTLAGLPALPGYLRAHDERRAGWRERLASLPGFKVGVCWSGNRGYARDRQRSLRLAPLLAWRAPGIQLISLQQGEAAQELAGLAAADIAPWGSELGSFADTAALVSELDLVISVDTAVAHLAGALGKPVWILLATPPDWRWQADGDTTPWYPQARLFRQTRRADWAPVLQAVGRALRQAAGAADAASADLPPPRHTPATASVPAPAADSPAAAVEQRLVQAWQAFEQGDAPAALQGFQSAWEQSPGHPGARAGLGALALAQGQAEHAEPLLREAVEVMPEQGRWRTLLARALRALGRMAEAVRQLETATRIAPQLADAWALLALCHKDLGQLEPALAAQRRHLDLNPGDPAAQFNLGNMLSAAGRLGDAAEAYLAALRLDPQFVKASRGLELACERIVAIADQTLAERPQDAVLHRERATALARSGHTQQAAQGFLAAWRLDPSDALTCRRTAELHHAQGRWDDARDWYQRALALAPTDADLHVGLAATEEAAGRLDLAAIQLEHALVVRPEDAYARFNRGLLRLLQGDLQGGLADYEARLELPLARQWLAPLDQRAPRWRPGEPLDGLRVLVSAEQGLGDTLMFARHVPALLERGAAAIVLRVQPELVGLLAGRFGSRVQVEPRTGRPADFDRHAALMSLPYLLALAPEQVTASPLGLDADARRRARWQQRLDPGKRLRIGVCWAGNPLHRRDAQRSMPLQMLGPLAESGVQLVSLQQRAAGDAPAELRALGMLDPGAELVDFADTAALVQCLDLVVSVDTAVAHLCGSLGKAVWIALPAVPDWRWGLADERTPWYPSARLFRQQRENDWRSVIERMRTELARVHA